MLDLKKLRGTDPVLSTLQALAAPVFMVERCADGQFCLVHLGAELQASTGLALDAEYCIPVASAFPTRMADAIAANYERALSSDSPIHFDEAHRLPSGDTWWRTTLCRAPEGPKGLPRIVGFTSEITDLRRREAGLVADIAELKLANREMQMLAGLTAHDMRAPLANVISLTGIVLDGFRDLGDGKRDMIAACRDVARSSIEAIDGLMQRIVPDTAGARRGERVDLHRVCAAVAGLVDPTERLTITYPRRAVVADTVILHVCLRNLVDNAARFAATRIDIALDDRPGDGMIALTVTDDGPGIPPDRDPLKRSVRDSGARGGYGLPTILRLLKSQGGTLTCRTVGPGETGGAFCAELPGRVLDAEPERLSA